MLLGNLAAQRHDSKIESSVLGCGREGLYHSFKEKLALEKLLLLLLLSCFSRVRLCVTP